MPSPPSLSSLTLSLSLSLSLSVFLLSFSPFLTSAVRTCADLDPPDFPRKSQGKTRKKRSKKAEIQGAMKGTMGKGERARERVLPMCSSTRVLRSPLFPLFCLCNGFVVFVTVFQRKSTGKKRGKKAHGVRAEGEQVEREENAGKIQCCCGIDRDLPPHAIFFFLQKKKNSPVFFLPEIF